MSMERVSVNVPDDYEEVDAQFDLAHGCGLAGDAIADVAGALGKDGAKDVATDATKDAAKDAVKDGTRAATEAGAEDTTATGAEASANPSSAAQEAGADVSGAGATAVPQGVAPATSSMWATFKQRLGDVALGVLVQQAAQAILSAGGGNSSSSSSSQSPSGTASSAQYWTALYNVMTANYPCNNGAGTACPPNVRTEQEALIAAYQQQLAQADPTAGTQAVGFSPDGQVALKQTLMGMTVNTGIPGLVQYMESYTSSEMSGDALVIATANVILTVTNFAYTD